MCKKSKNTPLLKTPPPHAERGSVITFLMIALALFSSLFFVITQGSDKSSITVRIERLEDMLKSDLAVIKSAITECILTYPDPVDLDNDNTIDATDNPNAPFPLYDMGGFGSTPEAIEDIECPGAPGQPKIFKNQTGRFLNFPDGDISGWTYRNENNEGVLVTIQANAATEGWLAAIDRLNTMNSACQVEVDTGSCTNGCLTYWFKLLSTATIHSEGGCP